MLITWKRFVEILVLLCIVIDDGQITSDWADRNTTNTLSLVEMRNLLRRSVDRQMLY